MADRIIRNFIGGESADAADGRTSDLVAPSTGEVFATAVVSGPEDVGWAPLHPRASSAHRSANAST